VTLIVYDPALPTALVDKEYEGGGCVKVIKLGKAAPDDNVEVYEKTPQIEVDTLDVNSLIL
jgi:hypothetical protein